MWTVIISVALSAATATVIAARVRREILDYVEDVCNINIEQTKKIGETSVKYVESLVGIINQNREEDTSR